jgi:hypothetical protein
VDQNLFGHFIDSATDWQQHPIAARLLAAQGVGIAQVWLSPTHVMELSLTSNHARRLALAKSMLEMIGATRMWRGFDFFILESFGTWLNELIPGTFDPRPFLHRYRRLTESLWLGNLGLFAATQEVPLGCSVDAIRRAKAETHLIHARIAADPDAYVANLVTSVRTFSTTALDPLGTGALSLEEMEHESQDLESRAKRPEKATLTLLQKERLAIASAYGAVDLGNAVRSILSWPCALHLTYDIPEIVAWWSSVMAATGCSGLPKAVVMADATTLATDLPTALVVMRGCAIAAATAKLAIACAGYYTVLREIEVCLNGVVCRSQA